MVCMDGPNLNSSYGVLDVSGLRFLLLFPTIQIKALSPYLVVSLRPGVFHRHQPSVLGFGALSV